jgi:hypothetical protein
MSDELAMCVKAFVFSLIGITCLALLIAVMLTCMYFLDKLSIFLFGGVV